MDDMMLSNITKLFFLFYIFLQKWNIVDIIGQGEKEADTLIMRVGQNRCILSQECIPVGCVPSAAVAVGGGGVVVCPGGLPGGGCLPHSPLPPVDRMTDACENITLLQLRCGR